MSEVVQMTERQGVYDQSVEELLKLMLAKKMRLPNLEDLRRELGNLPKNIISGPKVLIEVIQETLRSKADELEVLKAEIEKK